jgi:hypothetical protein
LTAAGVGILFGLPSLRIKGFYLAVATLAAQFFIVWCLTKFPWLSNNSSSGVISTQKLIIFGHELNTPVEKVSAGAVHRRLPGAGRQEHGAFGDRAGLDGGARHGRGGLGDRHRLMPTKLLAFAVSSFYCGVAGALYAFCYLGSVEPDGFSLDMSFKILFMIIIGGVGSIMGSFLGAAFILLLPIFLDIALPFLAGLFGLPFASETVSHIQILVFRCADHVLPDRRAARVGPVVADRQGETAFVAFPALSLCICGARKVCCWSGGGPVAFCNNWRRHSMIKKFKPALAAAAVSLAMLSQVAVAAEEQFFPLIDYRVGPYGSNGQAFYGGFIDYLNYVNLKEKGVNGVQMTYEECETEYNNAKGVECYERLKARLPSRLARSTRCRPVSPTR